MSLLGAGRFSVLWDQGLDTVTDAAAEQLCQHLSVGQSLERLNLPAPTCQSFNLSIPDRTPSGELHSQPQTSSAEQTAVQFLESCANVMGKYHFCSPTVVLFAARELVAG